MAPFVRYRGGRSNGRSAGLRRLLAYAAGHPYTFGGPTAFVLLSGGLLSARNYMNHEQPSLVRLGLSLAIVLIASVVAGFSMSHLWNRPSIGLRSVEEAEAKLPIPVLGQVRVEI